MQVVEDGDIFVGATNGSNDIYRIDRDTGAWTALPESPLLPSLGDLVILDDGNLAVTGPQAQALFLIDATTGEATEVISDFPVGSDLIRLPAATVVAPEPEPKPVPESEEIPSIPPGVPLPAVQNEVARNSDGTLVSTTASITVGASTDGGGSFRNAFTAGDGLAIVAAVNPDQPAASLLWSSS